jgi:hypothetical protein
MATLKAANGDMMRVTLHAHELRVKTSFGNINLPVAELRRMTITTWGGPANLKDGLIALWSGEDNARDSVEGRNGEMVGGASFSQGKVGQGFSFAGERGRVFVPDAPDFETPDSFTLAGWVYVNDFPSLGNAEAIIQRGDDRPGFDPWGVGTRPNGMVNFAAGTKSDSVELFAHATAREWFHLACIYDAELGRFAIYVNGDPASDKKSSLKPMSKLEPGQTPSLCLGNISGKFHTFGFHGRLDEWAYYGRALSPAEIQLLVQQGNAGERILPPPAGK